MTSRVHDECSRVLTRIQAYVDGELDTLECDVIERHCAGCETCGAVARGLRETIGLCREVGRAPLPEAVTDRARAQVKRLLAAARISSDRPDR